MLKAQELKRNNNWIVGYWPVVMFDFNNSISIDTLVNPGLANATACISDTNGNLLLYSTGFDLVSAVGLLILDGHNVNSPKGTILSNYYGGSSLFDQTSIILPKKGNTYYVFSTGMSDSVANNYLNSIKAEFDVLNYSIVDMDSNAGKGKVTVKNKILMENQHYTNCAMTAVRHGNGKDWWLVKADCENHRYQSFIVQGDTILGPYYYQVADTGDFCTTYSQLYFSNDGSKFASSMYGTFIGSTPNPFKDYNRVDLYDFDRCNGTFTFKKYYRIPYDTSSYAYYDVKSGISFSPNGKLLYVNNWFTIYQIDLEDTNTFNALLISGPDTAISAFPLYKTSACAPDGKLYIGNFSGTRPYMSYIDSPNIKGLGCHFVPNGVWQPYTNLLSPPNMPNYGLGKAPVGGNCWPDEVVEYVNVSEKELQVYPNPVTDILFIKTSIHSRRDLFNSTGQLIYSTKKNEIDVSNFAKGLYFLRCGLRIKRVIIE